MNYRIAPKPLVVAAFAAAIALQPVLPCAARQTNVPALFPDPLAATGKGIEIKQSEVEDAFVNYKHGMAANGRFVPDTDRALVESNLLQNLVLDKILALKVTDADKAAAVSRLNEVLAAYRKRAGSEEKLLAQITAAGTTLADFTNRVIKSESSLAVLVREMAPATVITDAAVKKFYDENPGQFSTPEEVRAAHILISTDDPKTKQPLPADQKKAKEKFAQEIKARADKGEDFAALAKQYSDDPGSKDNGGEYTFPRGQMVLPFETAAFTLKVNQISDLVETQYGYHIIKLLEKIPAKKVDMAEVAPEIKDYLTKQEINKQMPDYLPKIEKAYEVKILLPGAAPAESAK